MGTFGNKIEAWLILEFITIICVEILHYLGGSCFMQMFSYGRKIR